MNRKTARGLKLALKQRKDAPLTNEEVESGLQERKKLGIAIRNYAFEKNSLLREKEAAITESNKEEISRLDKALRDLEEEASHRGKDTRLEELTRLNQKNRQKNFVILHQAVKQESAKGIFCLG